MKPELNNASTDENHPAFNGALIGDEKTRTDAVVMTQFVERTRDENNQPVSAPPDYVEGMDAGVKELEQFRDGTKFEAGEPIPAPYR